MPRSKKCEKRLKTVHELNNALKDAMKSSAAGEGTKDVSRSAVPSKGKEKKKKVNEQTSGSVGDAGIETPPKEDAGERKRRRVDGNEENSELVVTEVVPSKKKKQVSMYSFFKS